MNKIAQNIINAVKRSNKVVLTQDEIFALVLDVAEECEVRHIKVGDIALDSADMTLSYKGKRTRIQKLEYELMTYLMANKDKVITREILMRDVWGADVYVGCRTIDVCVCKLRKLVGNDRIVSIKKVGYKFVS